MDNKSSNDWKLLKRVLKTAKPFKSLLIWSIILAIVVTPFSIAQPYIVQQIVDVNIINGQKDGIWTMALLFFIILIVNVITKYYFIYISADLGQSVVKELRINLYDHITNLRLKYFDKTPIGTSTTRTINDIEAINKVFAEGVITIFADGLTLLSVVAVMIITSWRLTLIVFITMPMMLIASYIFKEKVKVSYQKVRNQIANMNAFFQERISGMKVMQLFNAEKREAAKFDIINQAYTRANLDSVFYYSIFFPVVELVSAISLALMIWLGAKSYIDDNVSFGALVAFPMYLNLMFRPIRFMADKFNTLQMGLVAAERVYKLIDNQDYKEVSGSYIADNLLGKVEFSHVTFAYEDNLDVLKDVSFVVPPQATIALVGSTGSGKSTIINLLNRFYEIKSGAITINERNIKEYDIKSLRKHIAMVLQDIFLFNGTVYENITLKDKTIPMEKVIESAKIIGIHNFIENLPGGYSFVLSERGSNLSMGQRQLLTFVRALVTDPDILILDEATSSIDTESESLIQHAIEKLIKQRTSIIIAHRLSTIQHADLIYVLEGGKIIESGSHTQLLENENGHYRNLYDIQFSQTVS